MIIPKDPKQTLGVVLEFKHLHLKKRDDLERIKSRGHELAKEALDQIVMRGYEYAFSQHTHLTAVLKVGISFVSRCAISAYQRVELAGLRAESAITYVDVDLTQDEDLTTRLDSVRESKHKKEEQEGSDDEAPVAKKSGLRRLARHDSDDEDDSADPSAGAAGASFFSYRGSRP